MREEAIQFFSNLSIFATLIFIPLIAFEFHASPFETALIVMMYNMSVFLSNYACGRGADIYGRRVFLLIGLLASAGSFTLLLLAHDPLSLGLIRVLTGICVGIWGPALLAHVFEAKKSLGKVMGFGGLGWGTGVFLAGVLAVFWQIYLLSSLCFLLAFAIGLTLPRSKEKHHIIPLFPKDVIKKNLPAYLAVVIRHTGATAIWVLLPVYLAQEMMFSTSVIGYIYASNAFIQFFVMYFADRLPSRTAIILGLVWSAVTFAFFQWATMIWQWAVLLSSVGAAWSFLYVGATVYVMERNVERATSTGILQGCMSLAGITGPLVGGVISEVAMFEYNFHFAVGLSLVGLVIFLVTWRPAEEDLGAGPGPPPDRRGPA